MSSGSTFLRDSGSYVFASWELTKLKNHRWPIHITLASTWIQRKMRLSHSDTFGSIHPSRANFGAHLTRPGIAPSSAIRRGGRALAARAVRNAHLRAHEPVRTEAVSQDERPIRHLGRAAAGSPQAVPGLRQERERAQRPAGGDAEGGQGEGAQSGLRRADPLARVRVRRDGAARALLREPGAGAGPDQQVGAAGAGADAGLRQL